jgi:hypothetical protein
MAIVIFYELVADHITMRSGQDGFLYRYRTIVEGCVVVWTDAQDDC